MFFRECIWAEIFQQRKSLINNMQLPNFKSNLKSTNLRIHFSFLKQKLAFDQLRNWSLTDAWWRTSGPAGCSQVLGRRPLGPSIKDVCNFFLVSDTTFHMLSIGKFWPLPPGHPLLCCRVFYGRPLCVNGYSCCFLSRSNTPFIFRHYNGA